MSLLNFKHIVPYEYAGVSELRHIHKEACNVKQ